MAWKTERITMPMSSAGILGMSADMEISGIKIDPRAVIVATVIFVLIVKVAGIFIK